MRALLETVRLCCSFLARTEINVPTICRIGFGSVALKCRNCRISVHTDCKMQLAIACVPKSQGTPKLKNGQMGFVADYAPADGPMVPAVIVHCVNEVIEKKKPK